MVYKTPNVGRLRSHGKKIRPYPEGQSLNCHLFCFYFSVLQDYGNCVFGHMTFDITCENWMAPYALLS